MLSIDDRSFFPQFVIDSLVYTYICYVRHVAGFIYQRFLTRKRIFHLLCQWQAAPESFVQLSFDGAKRQQQALADDWKMFFDSWSFALSVENDINI